MLSIKHYKKNKKSYNYNVFFYYLFRYQRIFFGSLIWRGRKLWAFNFFLKLKYGLKIKEKIDPNIIFIFSLLKITPIMLLFPLKIGGNFQGVPLPISWIKKFTFATKWVIKLLRDKNKIVKLSDVIDVLILSIYNKGLSYERKIKSYKEGYSNRFLIRYFKY